MKTPRIRDFDPNAAPKLRSPMDDLPSIAPKGGRSFMPEEEPERAQLRAKTRGQKLSTRKKGKIKAVRRPHGTQQWRIPITSYEELVKQHHEGN